MSTRLLTTITLCAVFGVAAFAASANAQTRRDIRRGVSPAPVVPAPVPQPPPVAQPAPPPQQAAGPTPPLAADSAPSAAGELMESRPSEQGREGRLLRGRELIGLSIWGRNRERLGTVKDFIVDYDGDCPTLFFAMAPEMSGWSGGYVIVPFDAFQIGFDERQRTDYFVLGVTVNDLRRAPNLAVDKWNSIRDRQFFTDARQFYHRTERTAARPLPGYGRDGGSRAPREEGMQQPDPQRQTPAREETQPPRESAKRQSSDKQRGAPAPPAQPPTSGANPSTGGKSGAGGQQPQPAPPAGAPGDRPQKSGSIQKSGTTPSKPESAPGK